MTKQDVLKQYFGYDTFRGGQEEIIDALLAGRDVLAVMPTGAGKSVCYQVPALLLPGITLVVSPLVSLMRDQVTQLVQMGVPAAYLNSSLTYRQYLLALDGPGRAGTKIHLCGSGAAGYRGVPVLCPLGPDLHGGSGRGPLYLPVGAGLPPRLSEHP